jgi:hypothetical protein
MQNGPMLSRVAMQHLNARAPGPHGVHPLGTRMQTPGMMQLGGAVGQGMPGNTPYSYPNAGPQGLSHLDESYICIYCFWEHRCGNSPTPRQQNRSSPDEVRRSRRSCGSRGRWRRRHGAHSTACTFAGPTAVGGTFGVATGTSDGDAESRDGAPALVDG